MSSKKSEGSNITASFGADLCLSGFTNIPNLLLVNYYKLGLTDFEVILMIQLLRFVSSGKPSTPSALELSKIMSADEEHIQASINRLMEKKILSIKKVLIEDEGSFVNQYCFDALFRELSAVWAMEKQQLLLKAQRVLEGGHLKGAKKVYKAFEKEFGRLLNPMESQQITVWLEDNNLNPDLILEALKRASLRGVLNCRYIDKILLDWQKNNISTVDQLGLMEKSNEGRTPIYKSKNNKEKPKGEKGSEDDDEFALLYLS